MPVKVGWRCHPHSESILPTSPGRSLPHLELAVEKEERKTKEQLAEGCDALLKMPSRSTRPMLPEERSK
jgi:hypothetical protein